MYVYFSISQISSQFYKLVWHCFHFTLLSLLILLSPGILQTFGFAISDSEHLFCTFLCYVLLVYTQLDLLNINFSVTFVPYAHLDVQMAG